MADCPTLTTARLILRPFSLDDASAVQRLAGEWDIARYTLTIPHPYEDGMAEQFIESLQPAFDRGDLLALAVTTMVDGLIGSIGLNLSRVQVHEHAELGYWIGKPYWGRGYASEASAAVLAYAFTELRLHRIYAEHFPRNRASGRVLQKIGMTHEGRLREQFKRMGVFEDVEMYGILRHEWLARTGGVEHA